MTRRWRFTLVAAVIVVLSVAPTFSATTASATPLSTTVTSAEPAAVGTGLAAFWHPDGKQANVFYAGDNSEPCNGQVYNWTWDGSRWKNGQL